MSISEAMESSERNWPKGDYFHGACCDCTLGFTGPKRELRCYLCSAKKSPTTTTQKEREQAVIEAVGPALESFKKHYGGTGTYEIAHLMAKFDALNAPQPVKPEEVEPGTRFRFEAEVEMPVFAYEAGIREFVMFRNGAGTEAFGVPVGTHRVFKLNPNCRIIPLEGEELEDFLSRKAYEDTRDEESFTDAEVDEMLEASWAARNKEGK